MWTDTLRFCMLVLFAPQHHSSFMKVCVGACSQSMLEWPLVLSISPLYFFFLFIGLYFRLCFLLPSLSVVIAAVQASFMDHCPLLLPDVLNKYRLVKYYLNFCMSFSLSLAQTWVHIKHATLLIYLFSLLLYIPNHLNLFSFITVFPSFSKHPSHQFQFFLLMFSSFLLKRSI